MIYVISAFVFIASIAGAHADEAEPHLIQLQEYKPIYFIMGTPDTKGQFSLKAQIVRDFPLFIAYSQLVMWDLFKHGGPITDVNFNPETFYRIYTNKSADRWVDLGLFEHESNGFGGTTQERSWNRSSLSYHSGNMLGAKMKLLWSVKAWYPYAFNANSTDLAHYRGVWELQLTLVNFLGPFFETNELTLRIYPGGATLNNPLQGGQELTFKSKVKFRPILPSFVAQVFHGYGENLLNYQENKLGLRAGIGF